jgi:hypothetical protein
MTAMTSMSQPPVELVTAAGELSCILILHQSVPQSFFLLRLPTALHAMTTAAAAVAASSVPPSSSSSSSPPLSLPFSSNLTVDFLLLAEFDILKGSQVRLQYPRATGVKESVLAECMLPEGAHGRESDWTVFFLTNRMVRAAERERGDTERKARERAERKAQRERAEALQQPQPAADGRLSPTPQPPALPADTAASPPPLPSSPPSSSSPPASSAMPEGDDDESFFCVLNLCRTKYDRGVKRGAIVKSLALVTRYRFYNAFKPILMLALDAIFDAAPIAASSALSPVAGAALAPAAPSSQSNDAVLAIMQELYSAINRAPLPAELQRGVTEMEEALAMASIVPQQLLSSASSVSLTVNFLSTAFPLRLPLHLLPSEVMESSLTSLLSRFGAHTLDIYTALLSSRRVIFLAYQQPAASVCSTVLSSLLLISPPFPSLLHRAFPYTSLTVMDFLDTPGYIAGVTNPIFQQRSQWWDVLCDVSDGSVTLSPSYAEELKGSGGSASDAAFWAELSYGLQQKYGEEWLRCMFRDYTAFILSLVHDTAVFPDSQTRTQQLDAQSARINAILKSETFTAWMQRRQAAAALRSSPSTSAWADIERVIVHHVQTLRSRSPSSSQLLSILSDFNTLLFPASLSAPAVSSPPLLHRLLSLMPETQGGLMPLAMYVLHRDDSVRREVVRFLRQVDDDEVGKRWMGGLNYFLLMTYYREVRKEEEEEGQEGRGGAEWAAGGEEGEELTAAAGRVDGLIGGSSGDGGSSSLHSASSSISGLAAVMEQSERS